jgi:hypothetical protein
MRAGDAPDTIFIDEVKGELVIVGSIQQYNDVRAIVDIAQSHPKAVMYRR